MKLNDLKKVVAKAHQGLRLAEAKAAELQSKAKAAKAIAEKARLEHKRTRKTAKEAKHLALAADEHEREQFRAWEKAQKRLAKTMKKLAKAKGRVPKKGAQAFAASSKSGSSKPMPNKQMRVAPEAQKASAGSQSPLAVPGGQTANPASPTV